MSEPTDSTVTETPVPITIRDLAAELAVPTRAVSSLVTALIAVTSSDQVLALAHPSNSACELTASAASKVRDVFASMATLGAAA